MSVDFIAIYTMVAVGVETLGSLGLAIATGVGSSNSKGLDFAIHQLLYKACGRRRAGCRISLMGFR